MKIKPEAPKPTKLTRRRQERTEVTQTKLLGAATRLFSEQGFDGVTVRDIEMSAEVQRGLAAYHFKDKETLWKAVADGLFDILGEEVLLRSAELEHLSPEERVASMLRSYVRFIARHPELSRLLEQEGRQDTWRIRYLADHHLKDLRETLQRNVADVLGLSDRQFMHWFYLVAGASATIFSHAPEVRLVFGVDSTDEQIVNDHAELLVRLLLDQWRSGRASTV